jgi:hypothetical protein
MDVPRTVNAVDPVGELAKRDPSTRDSSSSSSCSSPASSQAGIGPLFQAGDVTLHSGERSDFKINCDALMASDFAALANMLVRRIAPFSRVEGVPRGGLRWAEVLNIGGYCTPGEPLLIVDDVLTTGASMEQQRAGRDAIGAVIFARGPCPSWVMPLFTLQPQQAGIGPSEKERTMSGLEALLRRADTAVTQLSQSPSSRIRDTVPALGDVFTQSASLIRDLMAAIGDLSHQLRKSQQAGIGPWLPIAERIARQAHAGQTEESTGDDYIRHIERVVALVDGDEAKAVAWLHDALEDTDVSEGELRRAGIPEPVIDAVRLLTRDTERDWRSYADYIEDIRDAENPLTLAVKLADLQDHLRPNCPERLRPRYEKALQTLLPTPPGDAK